MTLSDSQIERYSRQIILREVGGSGQRKLLGARCLLLGGGIASDVAATYLVGAGVGTLDLRRPDDPQAATGGLSALPPPAQRAADTRVRELSSGEAPRAAGYDVVLGFGTLAGAPPRARLGSVAVRSCAGGELLLAVLPGADACLACLAPPEDAAPDRPRAAPRGDAAAALAGAGALAALACCRLVLGIVPDAAPHALRLAPGSVAWLEEPAALVPRCERGCPPRGESV